MTCWKSLPVTAAAAALILTIVSCGGGSNTTDALSDSSGDHDQLDGIDLPSIDTTVSSNTVKAGLPVVVTCTGSGFDQANVKILVWDPKAGTPSTTDVIDNSQDATGAADASEPQQIDPDSIVTPPGTTIEDDRVIFTVAGTYYITCYAPDAGLLDQEPEPVSVEPGIPVSIDSIVEPTTIKAGEWVHIQCSAVDRWGNPITSGFISNVTPQDGIRPSGLEVQFIQAGDFEVGCAIEGTDIRDETPVPVKVEPNLAKKIYTFVDPVKFKAGESASVSCEVRDFYENPIYGFPVSVSKPAALLLAGKTLSTEKAGLYTVKCVPQNEDWDKFQLFPVSITVTPADPEIITLKVVPNKAVYGTNERIMVTMTTSDRYGNLIPNAPFAPVEITPLDVNGTMSPADGIKKLNGDSSGEFLLKKEGLYLLTFRLLADQSIYKDLQISVDGSGPLLTILYPTRGATISGKPSVTLVASVNDAISGVTKLTVNGKEEIPSRFIKNGTLTYQLPLIHQGLNTVEVSIVNGMGNTASETRGFQFSYKYYPMDPDNPEVGMVPKAVKAYLGRSFFDDGNHEPPPDDLATIIETIVGGLKIESLIPNPLAALGPYNVYLRSIRYDKPKVTLSPEKDRLDLRIDINNIYVAVEAVGKCEFLFIDFCPDVSGSVDADTIMVDSSLNISMDENGVFTSNLTFNNFRIIELNIDLDGFIGDLLDGLIDSLIDSFSGAIERALKQQMESMLNQTVADLLAKFKIQQAIEIPSILGSEPAEVNILTLPSAFKLDHPGLWLDMDAAIYGAAGVGHTNSGSISRSDCLKVNVDDFVIPEDAQVGFAAFDDVLNQALYAVWNTGTLNLTIGDDILGGLDLPAIVLKKVDLDFYEPPIITSCNPEFVWDPETWDGPCTVASEQVIQLQVGDAYARVEADIFGSPMYMELFVQAVALADLSAGDDGTGRSVIKIRLLSVPKIILDVISVDPAFLAMNGWTKDSFYNDIMKPIIAPLLDTLPKCEELVAFPIPVIDLSTLMAAIPSGAALNFYVEQFYRENGFTTVQGHLE
jgi:hypothetical protein